MNDSEALAARIRAGELPSEVCRDMFPTHPDFRTKILLPNLLETAFGTGTRLTHAVWNWSARARSELRDTCFNVDIIKRLLDAGVDLPWTREDCLAAHARIAPALQQSVAKEQNELLQTVALDSLTEKIRRLPGKVACVEAPWDGDTTGWFIVMFAVMQIDEHFVSRQLGAVKYGGDLRLFNGEVPAWPEAIHVMEVGQALAKQFDVAFHFPSPGKPDDALTSWLSLQNFG